jgi:hypothetical protein
VSSSRRRTLLSTPTTALVAVGGTAGVLVGSTVTGDLGTAMILAASLFPSVVLGGALHRARTALAHESWQRHRLAGEVAVADEQMRRLADRVDTLSDERHDDGAELERTRRQLRRARVEVATSRAVLAGVREEAVRARSAVEAATAARDEARAIANVALAEAEAAAETARRAEAALARATDPDREDAWRPPVRVEGQRSFASVDMRVFDAFLEADMADEHAVLDAPARRGRHAAEPALDPVAPPAAPASAPRTAPGATAPQRHLGLARDRDVA